MVLEKLIKENDIKKINAKEYPILAKEIREFLVTSLSKTGGHLASNLGAVELTMSLHLVLDFPEDKLIWDVGHQSYTHKILTGRKEGFVNLRKKDGMSGFPKRKESPCDCFDTGHSSTSISAGLGFVRARDLKKEKHQVVAVIGDGALTGGMAFEALNNLAGLDKNFIIVLNDNKMSIAENVGGLSSYLGHIRTDSTYTELKENVETALNKIPVVGKSIAHTVSKTKRSLKQFVIPGMFFEEMGITYLGPVDGHNIKQLVRVLQEAKRVEGPVLVHVLTEKGRGYGPAMRHPARFHGTTPFDISTGCPADNSHKAGYTDVFSTVMRKLGDRNPNVVAITAAMPDGTGLKRFKNMFPDRCFDVGIAEEHAVTFAAGLALGGLVPIVAIYSTFLQRAVDQILHDVCIQKLHVVFAVDRAGIVGSDGETHQGCFDLSYLSMIPNMTILAPKNKWELSDMLKFAVDFDGPIAIRYPRGEAYDGLKEFRAPIALGTSETIMDAEGDIVLFAVGSMVKTAVKVKEHLQELGIQTTLINARFVKPFDKEMINQLGKSYKLCVTMEENVLRGGFGEQVVSYLEEQGITMKTINIGISDTFIEHGSVEELHKMIGIDVKSIVDRIITEDKKA